MTDSCGARNCGKDGEYSVGGNSKLYCRQHYKQLIRRAARRDQSIFVVSDIKVDLEYGDHADNRVQVRFGRQVGGRYWLQVAHGDPKAEEKAIRRQRQVVSIRDLHADDIRQIAEALGDIAADIEREVDSM